MKNLLLLLVIVSLTSFGGGKDIYSNDLTRATMLGYVDGELTTVGDIADFAKGAGVGVETNAVRNIIEESFYGGTQKVNRVTGSFDGVRNRVDSLETATNDLASLVYGLTSKTNDWSSKQDAINDYTTTNAVCSIVTNHVNSGYLCTVAAAQAMTNDAMSAANDSFLKRNSSSEQTAMTSIKFVYDQYANEGVLIDKNGSLSVGSDYESEGKFTVDSNKLKYTGSNGQLEYAKDAGLSVLGSGIYEFLCGIDGIYYTDDCGWAIRHDLNDPRLITDLQIVAQGTNINRTVASNLTNIATLSAKVSGHETSIATWENYWRGDRVRLSVTNYYGNTSGEPPRLRIEEFDHSVTNGGVVSNFYRVVWDELTRQTSYYARVESQMGTLSNRVLSAAWQQTNLQLANKAPRAWQSVTSAGEDAPPNTVWHTAPSTVFAGGTEYAHVAVGEGQICVLVDKGAPVYTEGAEGQFRFCDETRQNYFGFDVRSAYTIGCRTDGIAVDSSTHIVSLTYDLTSASPPSILHSTNLVDWVDVEATWELDPPPGAQICYFNAGALPHGFFKAEMRHAGGSKFLTNMMADMIGGIAATNETGVSTATQLPIYPAITPTGIVWRVMQ